MPSAAPDPDYVVSGAINPNAAGNYFADGSWEESPKYKHETLDFWLWLMDGSFWTLSDNVGELTGGYWQEPLSEIIGEYTSALPNTGTAIVSAYVG